ncbi:MAG: CBS domain-containing protein [Candidatus Phosphoribacter sp.]|nr:CBS domain-containing protein [Actinomycetales bacterium]
MKISDVLRSKGTMVVTIRPDETVERLLEMLDDRGIGALVVSEDGNTVGGIVSERDVVRQLRRRGSEVLAGPVSEIMTREVTTCSPDDDVESLAGTMTMQRIRHVPVLDDGRLSAIVSIGDIVKHRISDLQAERDHLAGYIQQ